MTVDKTLLDTNRRELDLSDLHDIDDILPEYFPAEYPKLHALLRYYYDQADSDESPHRLIHQLFRSRDIVQTDIELLSFIEDELLLGQNYFSGFINKRAAAQYSSTLYRSKGTLYSIQQFFRSFFGITPEAVYTKENVFLLNESRIGSESQRYLTDDKLYQTYALLIKSAVPFDRWRDTYKLFVHPAGMYIGAEIQIISNVNADFDLMPDALKSPNIIPAQVGVATIFSTQSTDLTGILEYSVDSDLRITLPGVPISEFDSDTILSLNFAYDDLGEAITTNSPFAWADKKAMKTSLSYIGLLVEILIFLYNQFRFLIMPLYSKVQQSMPSRLPFPVAIQPQIE